MTAVPPFKESSRELIVEVARALEPYFPDITHHWREKLVAEFGFDGRTLAAAYGQGQIVLWDINPDAWEQRACNLAGRNLTRDEWHQYLGTRPYHKTCGQWSAAP